MTIKPIQPPGPPMTLGNIVAKRRVGRCREWIKIKNMAHPAIERAMLIALSRRRRPA
jgi:hypothetical protein